MTKKEMKIVNWITLFLTFKKGNSEVKPLNKYAFDLRSYEEFKSVIIEATDLKEAKEIAKDEYSMYTASYTGQLT
jgi:hypothetical protein